MSGPRALAAWTGPALVAGVVAAVAAGAPDAPWLVLAAGMAPMLALLQPPRAVAAAHPVALAVIALVAGLLVAAHLALLGDVAALLGARRWQGIAFAAALALLVTLMPSAARARGIALAAGGGLLLLVLAGIAFTARTPPTAAWRAAAARPALLFGARSPWVADGERFVRPSTLRFDEGHRVVALAAGTFRVVEDDGTRRVVRDWKLAAGDAVSLRPGDTLAAEAGSRLRFEAGKRVPGAAASGPAWADAAARVRPAAALGVLATLALGALALVPGGDRRALAVPAVALALSLGTSAWGVYATLAAPEAGLAGSPGEALLARALVPGARTLVVVLGLLALFIAAADALRERVAEHAGARVAGVWTAVIAVAALVGTTRVHPWTLLAAGLGLAGAAIAAPRLAAGRDALRVLDWPLEAIGALLGAATYAAVTVLAPRMPAMFAPLGAAPVLVAAPIAWIVVRMLRGPRGDGTKV